MAIAHAVVEPVNARQREMCHDDAHIPPVPTGPEAVFLVNWRIGTIHRARGGWMAAPSAVPVLIPAVSSTHPDLQMILEINRAAYDMLARTYKGTAGIRQENAKKWLTQRLPQITATAYPTALDIGCADGTHSRVLSALGYAVTGVDFSAPMITRGPRASGRPDTATTSRRCCTASSWPAATSMSRDGHPARRRDGSTSSSPPPSSTSFRPRPTTTPLRKVLSHVAPGGTALISTTTDDVETGRGWSPRTARGRPGGPPLAEPLHLRDLRVARPRGRPRRVRRQESRSSRGSSSTRTPTESSGSTSS